RRALSGERGCKRAHDGDPVPRAPRARGPGAGGRGVTLGVAMNDGAPRMVFLGFGKYVRADKIYALEPLGEGLRGHGARTRVWVDGIAEPIVASRTERRGHGARTRVWVDGIAEPIVASRTERAIITAMGGSPADSTRLLDEALDLAHRVADAAE